MMVKQSAMQFANDCTKLIRSKSKRERNLKGLFKAMLHAFLWLWEAKGCDLCGGHRGVVAVQSLKKTLKGCGRRIVARGGAREVEGGIVGSETIFMNLRLYICTIASIFSINHIISSPRKIIFEMSFILIPCINLALYNTKILLAFDFIDKTFPISVINSKKFAITHLYQTMMFT